MKLNVSGARSLVQMLLACVLSMCLCAFPALAGDRRKPSVLVLDYSLSPQVVIQKLVASGEFAVVDNFSLLIGDPTLETLLAYDAVLLYFDIAADSSIALGDTLADYVDAGGGVVSIGLAAGAPPLGRWRNGYLVQTPGGALATSTSMMDASSITDVDHPVLLGVEAFNGGTISPRYLQTTVAADATILAKWASGYVLAAAGPLPGRVDLNFSPKHSDAPPGGVSPTDGEKLMVNALFYVMRPRVLLLAGDPENNINDVKSKLRSTGLIGIVDNFSPLYETPTLSQLSRYDAVLSWAPVFYENNVACGNVLAEYVDAGGGVVCSTSGQSDPARLLGGRWASEGYALLERHIISPNFVEHPQLGSIAYPNHPIMKGVASFDGGGMYLLAPSGPAIPGKLRIAQIDLYGTDLAVVSTRFPNRADLAMYPPSSDVITSWNSASDGAKLMANALVYVCRPYVAVLAADAPEAKADVFAKLERTRRFSGVVGFDGAAPLPPASSWLPIHAILTWSNRQFRSAATVGNSLADFVDGYESGYGGGVVIAPYANTGLNAPRGRWLTGGYEIIPSPLPGESTLPRTFKASVALEPSHPLVRYVRKFDGGSDSVRPASVPLLRGRTILNWADGRMLASVHNGKKRVDLGMYPPSNKAGATLWNQRTDGTLLLANALDFAARSRACPGDFNGDGAVDDSDFVRFVEPYNALIDPEADMNGDGFTDDADFVLFVVAYNALVCP